MLSLVEQYPTWLFKTFANYTSTAAPQTTKKRAVVQVKVLKQTKHVFFCLCHPITLVMLRITFLEALLRTLRSSLTIAFTNDLPKTFFSSYLKPKVKHLDPLME